MRVGMLILSMASCLAASPALAENWRSSSNGQGIVAYIDVDSIKRKGDRVTFWRELRFPEVRSLSFNVRYDRMAAFYEADCKAMILRALKLRVRLGEKVVFKSNDKDEPQQALPGTLAENRPPLRLPEQMAGKLIRLRTGRAGRPTEAPSF